MGALSTRHVAELRLRRMMAAAYGRRSKPKKKIPEQRWPRAARMAYFLALKQVLSDLRAAVDRLLIPQLPRLLSLVAAGKPENLRTDAADDLKTELDTISDTVDDVIGEAKAKQIAAGVGQQVAAFNKDELNKQFKASVGIELLHGEPHLQQQLDLFAQDNARLITSLAADHVNQVSGLVMAAARAGTPAGELQDQISARFDVAESKAELLARDQVGKLNGELTQIRQSSVGVTEYEWSTSRDERVRTRHHELEGTSHSWDDPPVVDDKTGRRAHPGQDFQCRCTAIPKVDDILDALGADPEAAGAQPPPAPPPPPAAPPPAPPPSTPPSDPSTPEFTPPTASTPSTSSTPSTFTQPTARRLTFPLPPPSDRAPDWLLSASDVVHVERAGKGIHEAQIITLRDADGSTHRAVWKPSDEDLGQLRVGVARGTYAHREAAMHRLDIELGGEPVVPPTVVRELNGTTGSMQMFVEDGLGDDHDALEHLSPEQLASDPSARRVFLLDTIAAHDDRNSGNVLWRPKPDGGFEVVAIDNALAFPEGRGTVFRFVNPEEEFARAMMKLDDTSVAELQGLSLPRVAEILHEHEAITSRQIRETLARIRTLQIDPDQLDRLPRDNVPEQQMREWLARKPESRGLSAEDLAKIDRLAEKRK